MRHGDAPFRIYREGRRHVLWIESGAVPDSLREAGWTEQPEPSPSWTLVRGFTTLASVESWLAGVGRRLTPR